MSSPTNTLNRYRATYDWAGMTIAHKLRYRFPASSTEFPPKRTEILDVGAGWGKYRELLPEYIMDACEIWSPYIYTEMLEARYRHVYREDICDLAAGLLNTSYDVIIMGDVFEHIEQPRAKQLIEDIYDRCTEAYIVVPYEYPQGEVSGNPYEKHEQDDLTPKRMEKRYPKLKLIDSNGTKGLYILNKEE